MIYIFFIASFNALFFLVLLLQKKPKLLYDYILIFWLLYLGVATAIYAFATNYLLEAPFVSSGIIALFLLHGPFLYLYVSALTSDNKKFRIKNTLHFVPFLAFIFYLLVASQFPAYAEGIRIDHVNHGVHEPPFLFVIFLMLTALSGPLYFLLAHREYRKIKGSILEFSSRDINLDWLGKLITIFGIVWTLLIIIAVIHHVFHFFSMVFCTDGLFLSLSVFIILIGYYGLKQQEVFISFPVEEPEEPVDVNKIKYASSRLDDTGLQKCFNRIQRYMVAQKPYLDPDLTLPKLAKDLNVPAHHLSQVINEMHGKNFFDFINQFRVDEVKRKIRDSKFKKYSLLGIALESGFNSKSAFNRVFKNLNGTTPSEFRDALPPS
ncbi:helix-turn-helix domain-containing protein [Mariniflexile ostreae]|uniref:Helix-turn-helix domain-containing protein n=1 Tax=Mariniflexile ostreae TaxID=1520892 RepID=A0ABV5F8G1_9FLAO